MPRWRRPLASPRQVRRLAATPVGLAGSLSHSSSARSASAGATASRSRRQSGVDANRHRPAARRGWRPSRRSGTRRRDTGPCRAAGRGATASGAGGHELLRSDARGDVCRLDGHAEAARQPVAAAARVRGGADGRRVAHGREPSAPRARRGPRRGSGSHGVPDRAVDDSPGDGGGDRSSASRRS